MKFSDMPYRRPDIVEISTKYKRLTDAVSQSKYPCQVFTAIAEHERLLKGYTTMNSLAYIRNTINTQDEFYDKEKAYFDKIGPQFQAAVQEFMHALLLSEHKESLIKKYGPLLFVNMEIELKTFSPKIIPLLSEENRLVSEYQKLIASAKIDFDGKKLNISQLSAYKVNDDRERRKEAYTAEGNFYLNCSQQLDEIFDKLVHVRTEIAHKLGFASFTELGYLRRCRNCYGPDEIAAFRRQVVSKIVPLVSNIKHMQAERINIKPFDMHIYDDPYQFKEGNPKPKGTTADTLSAGKTMYEQMSRESAEFINHMYSCELLDVEAKEGKAQGGYCTSLPDYKSPFIFSNFNGTSGDVDVLTHEAGHAFADFKTSDAQLLELALPTIEACEVHSMAMEFMAWPHLHLFYGDDESRARFMHLASALVFIPYGCMVDHFQHIVYDNPTLTPQQRNEEWARLERIYRPYLKFGNVPFYSDGRTWQRQLHIYHYPFYYIDYCLAQTCALQFWELSQKDYNDAWSRYLCFVEAGGSLTFVELCKLAGIPTPFEKKSLETVAKAVQEFLR